MSNVISFLDACTDLPAAVSDMKATSTFLVIIGTVVEVNCKPGYKIAGDLHLHQRRFVQHHSTSNLQNRSDIP